MNMAFQGDEQPAQEAGQPTEQEAAPEAGQLATDPAEQEPQKQDRQPIPYDRFAKEVHRRRELEKKLAHLEGKLSATQPPSQPDWLQEPEQEADPVLSRLEQVERFHAETKLDRIVQGVSATNPQVPEAFVYQAVAAGADSKDAVLRAWTEVRRLAGIQENQTPAHQQRPAAPPAVRPAPRSAGPVQPKTMEEAATAMREFLRQQAG